MTHGKDPATYDIAKDILAEEIEHESWFLELIYGRPSGHMRRNILEKDHIPENTLEHLIWLEPNHFLSYFV